MPVNQVSLSGNLTRNAELRVTHSGMAALGFSVAVNERRRDPRSGEWKDRPSFVDCVLFGPRAEPLATRLAKGTKVCVSGRLRQERWVAHDGTNRSRLEVIVDDLDFMSRADGHESGHEPAGEAQGQQMDVGAYDADIPF